MSVDEGRKVEVLYNYSYPDDQGLVEIRVGDVYRLLEETNSEWWHVCPLEENGKTPPETEDDSFFVPAQYVRVLDKTTDQEVDSAIFSLDEVLGDEDERKDQTNCTQTRQEQNVLHGENQPQTHGGMSSSLRPPSINGMGKNADADGDYVNLDQFRAEAGIAQLDHHNVTNEDDFNESDYANLPFQLQQQKQQQQQQQQQQSHSLEQGPRLQDGQFVRVLVDGLPWDIYEDHSKRKFFHNRVTGELTWKPPRKDKPSSPLSAGSTLPTITQEPSNVPGPIPSPSTGTAEPGTAEPEEEYKKMEEHGSVFFVNTSTSERWQQLMDETGRQYYHRLGSNDTLWDLPTTPRSAKSEGTDSSPRFGETVTSDVGAVSSLTLNRSSKAKSMYGKIEQTDPGSFDPKAYTLPPNFAPGSKDQLCGNLNKAKIAEGRKKIKKSWAQVFVVLQSSNLVFYKDQKAAAQKPGSPHGKPDNVISLQGAKVEFNPPKDVTSRQNTILLTVSTGSQFLLHNDDEKIIKKWWVELLAANDFMQEQSPREPDLAVPRSGSTMRSLSESGTGQGGEVRVERMQGIRAKLRNLLWHRPSQEDLIKQGIIKDAVFGSSLQDLCNRDKSVVPNFILECITAVEHKGLEHEGLYRISGNLAEIQKLRYAIDKDEHHNLCDEQWDVHILTGALKLFFRELKEPLFPFRCVDKFLDASKKDTRRDKMKAFKEALSSLPKCNYETMRVLLQHLKNVVQFSAENRMQTQNIAIVFGPTLMWAGEGDFNKMAVVTMYQSKVIEFLLLEYENLFR